MTMQKKKKGIVITGANLQFVSEARDQWNGNGRYSRMTHAIARVRIYLHCLAQQCQLNQKQKMEHL